MNSPLARRSLDLSEISMDGDHPFATPFATPQREQSDYQLGPSMDSPSLDAGDDHLESDSSMSSASLSAGGYSPPAWRRLGNGDRSTGFWRQSDEHRAFCRDRQHLTADRWLRGETDDHSDGEDDIDPDLSSHVLEQAIKTRLPTGSLSPDKGSSPARGTPPPDDDTLVHKADLQPPTRLDAIKEAGKPEDSWSSRKEPDASDTAKDNYIRFAVRADIQHHAEPIEAAINFVRAKAHMITKSWFNMFLAALVALLATSVLRSLSQPAMMRPAPDLIKVAGVARSFEPLIYFSESGVSQVRELQDTGVAVWDLGESVRQSNMTSGPIIVQSLNELSESLNTLVIELSKFFANVDGDVDGILMVMDWARRELGQIQSIPSSSLSTAFSNIHSLLDSAGLMEDAVTGRPTTLGLVARGIFGMSISERTHTTLQRTFAEFLSVLEEAIENELHNSLAIVNLFDAIDQQYLNLARTVARESRLQEERQADDLSSLWTWLLGPKKDKTRKFEQNRALLGSLHDRTVINKGVVQEHQYKLIALKARLESLRRKLVSPLVRSANSSTLTIEEQMRGLEDVGTYLTDVRQRQKGKLMEILYGSGGGSRVGAGTTRYIEQGSYRDRP